MALSLSRLPTSVRSHVSGTMLGPGGADRIWFCSSGPHRLAGEHTCEQLVPVQCVRCGLIGHTAVGRGIPVLQEGSPVPCLSTQPPHSSHLPSVCHLLANPRVLGRVSPAPPLVFQMMHRTVLSAPTPDPAPVVLRQLPPLWAVVTGLSDQLLRVCHLTGGGTSRLRLVPAGPKQTTCSVST